MRSIVQRVAAVAVLALWMAPNVTALGIGLHLALDHHGAHQLPHVHALSDLAQAASHGHHHPEADARDHQHEAIASAVGGRWKPESVPVAVLRARVASEGCLSPESLSPQRPRRAPPPPLFTSYCSLLL